MRRHRPLQQMNRGMENFTPATVTAPRDARGTKPSNMDFISAGGGEWYSNTLSLLSPGDRVWVKAPGHGFVGVGIVTGKSVRATEFKIKTAEGEHPVLSVVRGNFHRNVADDPKRSEYFVPIDWLSTVPIEKAFNEAGLFGNQNTVCRPKTPKWRHTVERLKQLFPEHGD